MKTYQSFVYSVDGIGGPGGIVDLSQPANPVVVGTFPGGHNIFIDDAGYLYVCLPGLKIYDLNDDPTAPALVWEAPVSNGSDGHDATVVGSTLYEFRGASGIRIWDVTNHSAPLPLGDITDPRIKYAHNGWPTTDGQYLFVTDELALDPTPDITVWDIREPLFPRLVASISDPEATVHNCYVVGDVLYVAYYVAGFRLYDISDPLNPVLLDTEDTSPLSGEGSFEGAFGVYPFSPDGYVYVSDRPNGLFVFRIDGTPTGVGAGPVRAPALELRASAPNPFSHATGIHYSLAEAADVSLEIFDATGHRVRQLESGARAAGEHVATWDGRGDDGARLPSGVYFCRASAGSQTQTGRLVLVR
jgi:hypothetical protein